MKKVMLLFYALILSVALFAQNAPKTQIPTITCKVGDEVAVPILTDGYKNVISLTLSVRYNPVYLEYLGTEVADEFRIGGPFGDGMLINDYLLNGTQGFRCIAVAWYKLGGEGIHQKEESILYHRFRARTAGTANIIFIDKTSKNPLTVCEWGAVRTNDLGEIVELFAMPEPPGTYQGGSVVITP